MLLAGRSRPGRDPRASPCNPLVVRAWVLGTAGLSALCARPPCPCASLQSPPGAGRALGAQVSSALPRPAPGGSAGSWLWALPVSPPPGSPLSSRPPLPAAFFAFPLHISRSPQNEINRTPDIFPPTCPHCVFPVTFNGNSSPCVSDMTSGTSLTLVSLTPASSPLVYPASSLLKTHPDTSPFSPHPPAPLTARGPGTCSPHLAGASPASVCSHCRSPATLL